MADPLQAYEEARRVLENALHWEGVYLQAWRNALTECGKDSAEAQHLRSSLEQCMALHATAARQLAEAVPAFVAALRGYGFSVSLLPKPGGPRA